MGVHWDAAFTRWWPHKEGEKVFSLAHLDYFTFTVEMSAKPPHPQRVVKIQVGFSSHCFTTKWASAPAAMGVYKNSRERRWFELERYELSRLLPGIVRTLPRRKIFFGVDENFLTIELPCALSHDMEYRVFFRLRRYEEDGPFAVLLVVQSAYRSIKEVWLEGQRKTPVKFNVLLRHALSGTTPKRPP